MRCHLCNDEWPDAGGLVLEDDDHIRVIHPDQYSEPERWPDEGGLERAVDPQPEDYMP